MSSSASSSIAAPRTRTSRKSVSTYRSPIARGAAKADGRPLHSSRSQGSRALPSVLRLEIDLRYLLRFGRRLEERIFLEAEHLRRQVGRKLPPRGVVVLHALVVAHALDGDAVFRSGELVHQAVELFVRFQVRIVLGDREQPSERGRLLVRGLNRFFRRFRRDQARARLRDLLEDALLVRRVP